ncbi:MAG: preprotein translocase subunit YajC [Prevotella sp.]|nr:preprotein translocase subunit YajC [Prevotella sp.]
MTALFLADQSGNMSFLIMMLLFVAIMYFLIIRPQQKKQKEIRNFQNALAEGAKVVTGGGIYGTVRKIDLAANVVEVEIARGVIVRVDRGYVFADTSSAQQSAQVSK